MEFHGLSSARLPQPTLSFFFVVLQTMFCGFVAAVLSFIFTFPLVTAFTYSFGTPSECDNVPLTWTGESFVPNLTCSSHAGYQEGHHHFNC